MIFRDCSETLHTQELLEGCPIYNVPLAVHVPMNPEEIVPEGAFAGVPRLRHSPDGLGPVMRHVTKRGRWTREGERGSV